MGCGSSEPGDTKAEETEALPPGATIIPVESQTPAAQEAEDFSMERAESVLADFLSATALHLKGDYSGVYTNGMKEGPTPFELWQKDGKIRIDYYRDGALYRTLIVSDNKAMFYVHKSKGVTPSIMPAGYYADLFGQDFSTAASQPASDGKSAVFSFEIDRFYKNEGAQAGYYVTRIEYAVDGNSVLNQVVCGKDSYGTKPSAVNTVTQTLPLVETDGDIDDALFNAPF